MYTVHTVHWTVTKGSVCTICIYTTVRRLIDESKQFHNVKMVIFAVMFLLLLFFLFYTYIRFGKYAKYLVTTQNIIKLNRLLSRLKMLFLRTIRFSYIYEISSPAPYHLWSIFYSTQQQQHGATYYTQNQEREKNAGSLFAVPPISIVFSQSTTNSKR